MRHFSLLVYNPRRNRNHNNESLRNATSEVLKINITSSSEPKKIGNGCEWKSFLSIAPGLQSTCKMEA